MHTYNDLVEVARLCLLEARKCVTKEAAEELRQIAKEYQAKAAELNGGELPNIGEPPLESPVPQPQHLPPFSALERCGEVAAFV
jgi:hypothetical protein